MFIRQVEELVIWGKHLYWKILHNNTSCTTVAVLPDKGYVAINLISNFSIKNKSESTKRLPLWRVNRGSKLWKHLLLISVRKVTTDREIVTVTFHKLALTSRASVTFLGYWLRRAKECLSVCLLWRHDRGVPQVRLDTNYVFNRDPGNSHPSSPWLFPLSSKSAQRWSDP